MARQIVGRIQDLTGGTPGLAGGVDGAANIIRDVPGSGRRFLDIARDFTGRRPLLLDGDGGVDLTDMADGGADGGGCISLMKALNCISSDATRSMRAVPAA